MQRSAVGVPRKRPLARLVTHVQKAHHDGDASRRRFVFGLSILDDLSEPDSRSCSGSGDRSNSSAPRHLDARRVPHMGRTATWVHSLPWYAPQFRTVARLLWRVGWKAVGGTNLTERCFALGCQIEAVKRHPDPACAAAVGLLLLSVPKPLYRERAISGVDVARPARMTQRSAEVTTASAASAMAQHVGRCVLTPADDQRRERPRCRMRAAELGAAHPHPARAAAQLCERRNGTDVKTTGHPPIAGRFACRGPAARDCGQGAA